MSGPGFVLAPMDGMTRASFRRICFDYCADGATTEMIQSLALGRARRRLSETFAETMIRLEGEGDLAAQLIGSVPEMMTESARRLTAMGRFDAIEINMGCPARCVVGSGNGAALLKTPERAVAVMRAVRGATELPVRLKLRLGWDETRITAPELVAEAQALGFQRVTVHGRTRAQMYREPVDAAAIRAICEGAKLPVYANGGVMSAGDALSFLRRTGAAGVSIGRAALKQPWIFDDIRRLRRGEPVPVREAPERVALLIRLATMACLHRPEKVALCEMRKFSRWFLAGLTGWEDVLEAMNRVTALDDFRRLLEGFGDALARAGDTLPHPESAPEMTLDTV